MPLKKIFILLGVVLLATAILAACGSATPTAPPVTQAPTQAPTEAPTQAPVNTAVPPTPAPTQVPPPFTAQVSVVAMNPSMGGLNPDTGRYKGIQVARGDDPKKTYALFSPGTRNVPPGVPVYVEAGAIGVAQGAKVSGYNWTLKGPDGSTATIANVEEEVPGLSLDMASFVPDLEGEYVVSLVVTDDKGASSAAGEMKIVAAKYVGNETCKTCHADQYEKWSATLHGGAFKEFVNTNVEAEYFSAGYGCARCHTVGYYPVAASTGGWWEMMGGANGAKNWPTKDIALNAFNEEEGKDTFSTKFKPEVQAVSNIGCESCHGPGGAHVAKPGADTAPKADAGSGSCNQCHAAGGHHTRGNAVMNSKHAQNGSDLTSHTNGREACAKCHSGEGHIDTLTGASKVSTDASELGCPVCHDPHDATNAFQLRKIEKVSVGGTEIENAGLSAGCMECHNNNSDPKSVETDKPGYPHYSSAAELLTGVGGYDFGATLVNGYHTNIGKGVLNDENAAINDGEAPGSCVLCHMYVTPGGIGDSKNTNAIPGHQQIGGHTFTMVSEEGVEHTAPCQQCHPGVTTFNFPAKADYDGNGKIEGVQTEVKGLLDLVEKEILAKGVTKLDGYPYFNIPQDASTELKGAIYNFRYVNGVMWSGEGKGAAIHNFERSVQLLQLSYKALTGKDVPGATLINGDL